MKCTTLFTVTLDFVAFLFVPFVFGRQTGVARLHHQRPHDAQGKDGAGNGDQTGKTNGTDKQVHTGFAGFWFTGTCEKNRKMAGVVLRALTIAVNNNINEIKKKIETNKRGSCN